MKRSFSKAIKNIKYIFILKFTSSRRILQSDCLSSLRDLTREKMWENVLLSRLNLRGLFSLMSSALALIEGGSVPANASSIETINATVTNDLIIMAKLCSLVNVKIRAQIVTIELIDCMNASKMFIRRPLLWFFIVLDRFKYVIIRVEFSKSLFRVIWKRIPHIMLTDVCEKENGW